MSCTGRTLSLSLSRFLSSTTALSMARLVVELREALTTCTRVRVRSPQHLGELSRGGEVGGRGGRCGGKRGGEVAHPPHLPSLVDRWQHLGGGHPPPGHHHLVLGGYRALGLAPAGGSGGGGRGGGAPPSIFFPGGKIGGPSAMGGGGEAAGAGLHLPPVLRSLLHLGRGRGGRGRGGDGGGGEGGGREIPVRYLTLSEV